MSRSRSRLIGNLPAEVTSFVGRRGEIGDIKRLLSRSRLVTVTGVGGVGKTRLALQVAGQVRRSFADGVWLVELAAVRDHRLLAESVSKAVGIADQTARDRVEVLAEVLADRQLLLVMDCCEHLVPAVAHLAVELLRAVPGLRILATSREALAVPAEHLYPVAPLPVPVEGSLGAEPGARYPAMVLFAERAAAVDPEFAITDENAALVTRVCRRLDGIPLAIELAAARLRSLSLAQVAERLDDRFRLLTMGNRAAPARQQTLLGAVEWSFELCTKPERLLWIRTAVFAGSFDLEAAERVCGADKLSPGDVLEALSGLVAKSVLVPGSDQSVAVADTAHRRYRLLDTIGGYGLDRLRDPDTAHHLHGVDEATLRRRHRDYYLELAEQFHADWFGPHQLSWSQRMHAELPNFRAALGFGLDAAEQARAGVRLAGALHYLWCACGQAREGRLWLERVLAADPHPSRERMRALATYTSITWLQGDPAAAVDLTGHYLELARRFDEPAYVAEALTIRGLGHLSRNEPQAAAALLQQAVAFAAELDPAHPQVAYAKVAWAHALRLQGDTRRAGELLADSQRICRAHGDLWFLGHVLYSSAEVALGLPDTAQALSDGRESLRLRQALHDTFGAAQALELLAWVAVADRSHVRAARLLGAADQQWQTVGGSLSSAFQPGRQARAAVREALGGVAFDAEHRRGADLTLDDAVAYALGVQRTPAERGVGQTAGQPRLTRRESEIAELVAQGLTNRQIAAQLVISPRTVESHIENILVKLGFTSRTQLATWTVETRSSPRGDPPA